MCTGQCRGVAIKWASLWPSGRSGLKVRPKFFNKVFGKRAGIENDLLENDPLIDTSVWIEGYALLVMKAVNLSKFFSESHHLSPLEIAFKKHGNKG